MTRKKEGIIKIFAGDGGNLVDVPGIDLGGGWTMHHRGNKNHRTLSFMGYFVTEGSPNKCTTVYQFLKNIIKPEYYDGLETGKAKIKPEHKDYLSGKAAELKALMEQ